MLNSKKQNKRESQEMSLVYTYEEDQAKLDEVFDFIFEKVLSSAEKIRAIEYTNKS